jgi:F420-dependent oxidoreductase-like protein
MAREKPVTFAGEHYQLPYPGGTGLGKPLRSTLHPYRPEIPILLGAEGPKNVALAAEIADGWLPLFFSPKSDGFYREALADGFARPGARHTAADLESGTFDVAASVPVVVADDLEAAADRVRPTLALYIGGMGARGTNFHLDVFARMGWEAVCAEVQDAYLDGRKGDAVAAIPTELVEDVALVGPPARIRDRLQVWDSTVVSTLLVQASNLGGSPLEGLHEVAEVLLG